MLDAREALEMGDAAAACEFKEYADSWRATEGPVRPPQVPRRDAAE